MAAIMDHSESFLLTNQLINDVTGISLQHECHLLRYTSHHQQKTCISHPLPPTTLLRKQKHCHLLLTPPQPGAVATWSSGTLSNAKKEEIY